MNWLLILSGVGLIPALLAAKLPRHRVPLRRDRKIAVGIQALGGVAMAGGSIWYLWLVPQLFMSAGCGIASSLLMVLTFFTVTLPCQTSIPLWIDIAQGLVAFGLACLTYGTIRRVVLSRRSPEAHVSCPLVRARTAEAERPHD